MFEFIGASVWRASANFPPAKQRKVRRRGRVRGGGGSCQVGLTQAGMKILGGQETSSDTLTHSPLPPVPGHPPFSPVNCIVQPERFSAGQTLSLCEAPWFLPQMLTSSRSSLQKWKMEYCAINVELMSSLYLEGGAVNNSWETIPLPRTLVIG